MSEVILQINNQVADIGDVKSLNIKFNRQFIDLQNIDSKQGDYSFSIKLPKTKTNNIIFENINVQNVIDKFFRTEDYEYFLDVDGTQYTGVFKLLNIDEESYIGTLIGKNIAWAKLLSGKNLNDLTNADGTAWSAPYIGSSGSTTNSLRWYINNTDYTNSDIAFPLISRGMFWHGLSGSSLTWNEIFDDSLTFQDIPPAVYEGKIVKKIFENIGWSVDSDLFGNEEYQKIILPYTTADQYLFNWQNLIGASSSGGTGAPLGIFTGYYNDYNRYGTTGSFNYIKAGLFELTDLRGIISNPYSQLRDYLFVTTQYKTKHREQYYVPALTQYNIDLTFDVNDIFLNGAFSAQTDGRMTSAKEFKAGFFLYINDGTDINTMDVVRDTITQDINDYFYNQSPDASPTDGRIIFYYDLVQKALFNYGGANNYSFYAQPYADADAEIVITDNLHLTYSGDGTFNHWNQFHVSGRTNVSISGITLSPHWNIELMFGVQYDRDGGAYNSAGGNAHNESVSARTGYAEWSFSPSISGGTELNIGANLPAISQLEFIKSFLNRHNCFISTNSNNKSVRFDTYDNYFLPLDYKIDLTEKLDLNNYSSSFKPALMPKNLYFKYTNDTNDILIGQDPDYGNIQLVNDNIYSQNDKQVTQLYSATKLRDFVYQTKFVSLPSICNDASIFENIDASQILWTFASSPRILKITELWNISGTPVTIKIDGQNCEVLQSVFEDHREDKLNLIFNTITFTDNSGLHYGYGLYNQYYERYLNSLSQSHILGAIDSNINGDDFNKLQPNVPVVVNGESYILNSIQGFDPINQGSKCKIELIKRFTN